MIIDELVEIVLPRCGGKAIADVRIGLGYTSVRLADGGCGLAYTFRGEIPPGCNVILEAGSLAGRPAAEIVEWAARLRSIEASVGVATLNALIPVPDEAQVADIVANLEAGPDDVVGMVGYFGPVVKKLRKRVARVLVFERTSTAAEGLLPDWAAPKLLPECNIAIVSATTIINRTLDGLLAHCKRAREVVLLGPTTPMLPGFFARRGVTMLSGLRVKQPERLLQIVSEGGGTRTFGPAVEKVTLRTAPARDRREEA